MWNYQLTVRKIITNLNLVSFSMLGLVVGAGDATVNKKLLPSGEIDKQVGNYDIV